jgi:hypothetical protein
MTQPAFAWSSDVRLPVAPSPHPIARHTSATGAQVAAAVAGRLGLQYLALLGQLGQATDHQAARILGAGLSSINSTRSRLARWVIESGEVDRVYWPGGRVSERAYWRRATPAEIAAWDLAHAEQPALCAEEA